MEESLLKCGEPKIRSKYNDVVRKKPEPLFLEMCKKTPKWKIAFYYLNKILIT